MGVFGLFTQMKQNPEFGYEEVSLKEIARKYREQTQQDPVMLVDISSCSTFFMNMGSPNDSAVDMRLFQKNLEIFINNCFEMGIKLIFVGEGMRRTEKYERWIKKKQYDYKHPESNQLRRYSAFHFGSVLSACPAICRMTNKCEYVRDLYEADEFIIRYAKARGCFAILSNDSDFIFVEGAHYCLSVVKLDLDTMSTYNFNRNALSKALSLSPSQLPVFGSILQGGYYGAQYKLKRHELHKNPLKFKNRLSELSLCIRSCPVKDDPDTLLNYLTAAMDEEEAHTVQENYRFYSNSRPEEAPVLSGNENWDGILRAAERRHITGVSEKRFLEILSKHALFLPLKYPMFSDVTCVHLLKPLRVKMYGLIFSEFPGSATVTEYTFIGCRRNVSPDIKEVQFDKRSHPGLLELWSQNRSKEMMYKRRRLFCEIIDDNLTPEILDALDLPEELLFPVLAVFYLQWHTGKVPTEDVLTLILTGTILSYKLSRNMPPFPVKIDFRPLKMSEMYLTLIDHLQLLQSICGEPFSLVKTSLHSYYDGNIFQNVYENMLCGFLPKSDFYGVNTFAEVNNLRQKLDKLATSCSYTVPGELGLSTLAG